MSDQYTAYQRARNAVTRIDRELMKAIGSREDTTPVMIRLAAAEEKAEVARMAVVAPLAASAMKSMARIVLLMADAPRVSPDLLRLCDKMAGIFEELKTL